MWYYSCPQNSGLVSEFHSYSELDEALTAHEEGILIPGFREFKSCSAKEYHEYWDDGVPCSTQRCKIPYIPEGDVKDTSPKEERRPSDVK